MSLLRSTSLLLLLLSSFPVIAQSEVKPLYQQVPAGFAQPFTWIANQKVERIFLTTYQNQYHRLRLESNYNEVGILLNAPITGRTTLRGRSLLTFAAFSGFLKLASWGLKTGSDINRGDKDNATLLRMAIANKLEYVVEFALRRGANPNMLQGSSLDNTLGDMMRFSWPLSGFELAWKHGARLKDDEQRVQLKDYLTKITDDEPEDQANLNNFLNLLNSPLALVSQAEPNITSKPAALTKIYMIGEMDNALLGAIKNQQLTMEHIEQFNVHGMYLPHYLTFNSMTSSLDYILKALPPAEAENWITKRDRTGNDLIIAAIKSLNPNLLRKILSYSSDNLNIPVPDTEGYYSRGDTPLHIAIKWHSSEEIFDILFEFGASKSLEIENSFGFTPEQMLDRWYSTSRDYDRLKAYLTPGAQ